MIVDSTFEFEKNKIDPIKYNRDLVVQTVQAIKKINSIKERHDKESLDRTSNTSIFILLFVGIILLYPTHSFTKFISIEELMILFRAFAFTKLQIFDKDLDKDIQILVSF